MDLEALTAKYRIKEVEDREEEDRDIHARD
jgi:hypothetical protein